MKSVVKLITAIVAITALLFLGGCENQSPMSSIPAIQQGSAAPGGLQFLKLKSDQFSLNKNVKVKKWVTRAAGDILSLENESANGNFLYAIADDEDIYRIFPSDVDNPVLVGHTSFKTKTIALHPTTGLVYYAAHDKIGDLYPVATWDPATNTNSILASGSLSRPASKLTFGPDGTLYGVPDDERDRLYTINTTTGEWTLFKILSEDISNKGDLAIGPDNVFYNFAGAGAHGLETIDLTSGVVSDVGGDNPGHITGLGFTGDGQLYISKDNGDFWTLDESTGEATYIGDANVNGKLDDLSSYVGEPELSYVGVSLEILPNSISDDSEIEISVETTELVGGVALTFQPHGTTFDPPAVLNIEAHGVDFSGINPNNVDVYYDNQQTGQWELMQRDDIIIDAVAGTINVINARLPHFSRYAIGAE